MKAEEIDTVVAELRDVHPELDRPLTWEAMSRILARERITLLTIPLIHDAQVISCDGVSVIAINSNAPVVRHTYYAAHEWGHIKLHFRERGEIVYHTSACWPDDPREDDAEYFATSLLMGPQRLAMSAESTVGTVTRHGASGNDEPIVGKPKRRRPPGDHRQVPLALPGEPPSPLDVAMGRARREVLYPTPKLEARLLARDRAERIARAKLLDERPRMELVIDDEEGRRVRKRYFVDRDGHRWRLYDMMAPGRMSKATKNYPVEPPSNWAVERVFVRDDGERRVYSFRFRDEHGLEPLLVERQLKVSKPV